MLAVIGGGAGLLPAWVVVQSFHAAPPPAGALPFAIDFRVKVFPETPLTATAVRA